MILDLLIVAVTIVFITTMTAKKGSIFSRTKQNSITAGLLFTIIQLMIFITRLEFESEVIPDFYKLTVSVLVKFRPLLIGCAFRIIFSFLEDIVKKNDMQNNINSQKEKTKRFDFALLSRREIEVARLAARGYTNAQIAEELFISTETVKSHMNSIMEKLNISSRKELILNYSDK